MKKLIIEQGGPLHGRVRINGAKNAVLPIMAACLLSDDESVIERVPLVTDVRVMSEILRRLGVDVTVGGDRVSIRPGGFTGVFAPYEMVSAMRASVCVLGPLLARHGQARVAKPGGCVIGSRPIDLHLKGLEALGARFDFEKGDIVGTAKELHGAIVHLSGAHGSSVLATGNVMMAAVRAKGRTVIERAACEPEVVDLANFLIAMGACIEGHGTSVIQIEGVSRLIGARYRIIPDRIETGTLMIAAAISGGDLIVEDARPEHLDAVIDKLSEANVKIDRIDNGIRVSASKPLRGVDVTTLPFPGFPTDLQAQISAMCAVARGTSVITEQIYPERFMHVEELNRMGASISREGNRAVIQGVRRLSGAPVEGSDLRASAALVLAGLVAEDRTEVRGLEHLDRGYQNLEKQLSEAGAKIRRITERRRKPRNVRSQASRFAGSRAPLK